MLAMKTSLSYTPNTEEFRLALIGGFLVKRFLNPLDFPEFVDLVPRKASLFVIWIFYECVLGFVKIYPKFFFSVSMISTDMIFAQNDSCISNEIALYECTTIAKYIMVY